jgi:hypothetical protein
MPTHYDKKFTSKIRKTLRNYEVENYEPAHWDDLKERLDAQKKPFYVQYSWFMGFSGSVLFFILLGLGFYPQANSNVDSATLTTTLEKKKELGFPKNNTNTNINVLDVTKSESKSDLLEQEKQVVQHTKVINSVKDSSPNGNLIQNPIVKNTAFVSNKNVALLVAFDDKKETLLVDDVESELKLETEFAVLNKAHIDLILKKATLELRQFENFPINNTLSQKRFEFGFSLSPLIYSNKDEREPTKSFTLQGGLHGEWGLGKNRNLKLGTALLLSRNSLAHKEKTTTARTVPDPTDTENADYTANFLILNVPLYLRYDFGQDKKTNFFISGGVSNYTYVRESYNYTLKYLEEVFDPQDPTVIIGHKPATFEQKEVKVFSQWNILSTVDLSMGVRTKLGHKTSLLISPYLRLPIKDLATENVRFSTAGLHLQLNLTN